MAFWVKQHLWPRTNSPLTVWAAWIITTNFVTIHSLPIAATPQTILLIAMTNLIIHSHAPICCKYKRIIYQIKLMFNTIVLSHKAASMQCVWAARSNVVWSRSQPKPTETTPDLWHPQPTSKHLMWLCQMTATGDQSQSILILESSVLIPSETTTPQSTCSNSSLNT